VKVLSLFSGIGGLDLGLERAGMTIAGQVEIDPWCRKVLAKHWPEVPRHDDVRTAVDWWLGTGLVAHVVAGGFPCQDVSDVGGRAGIEGQHSGLWAYFVAMVRALRPLYVVVENTPGLLARGMGRVIGDLAASGYDAEWDCVPAAAIGAPHLRTRLWILAYPAGQRGANQSHEAFQPGWHRPVCGDWWRSESSVDRVAHGIPGRVDRLRGLGNAVVPQVAEHIGRLIMEAAA
jgi:DNA (cytosine-5)-methyltransferase 1